MNVSAYTIFRRACDEFTIPPTWSPDRWRRSPVFACGLTALAVEAALRDQGAIHPVVLRDPEMLDPYLDGTRPDHARGVLGCSFGGRSPEVVAGLARAERCGVPTCRISRAMPGADILPDVVLPEPAPPAHLGHIVFAAVIPLLFSKPISLPVAPPVPNPTLLSSLADIFQRGLLPVFIGAGHCLRARLLRSYWIEFLGRPAFTARYPDWTHDLLWALERSRDMRLALIIEPPTRDLPDHRYERMLGWATERNLTHCVLQGGDDGTALHTLLAAADLMIRLAGVLGIAQTAELIFDESGKVVSR